MPENGGLGSDNFVADISQEEKYAAFQELMGMISPIPDIDYDKELAEYFEEKYGISIL